MRSDDQKIEIAVPCRQPLGIRAVQDDPFGLESLQQPINHKFEDS
jgi:hypothetical protein